MALVLEHLSEPGAFFAALAPLVRVGGELHLSEIHPDRARQGRLAHFTDPATGEKTWLDSRLNEPDAIREAARAAGFECVDVVSHVSTR